jgi:hypothetical protein
MASFCTYLISDASSAEEASDIMGCEVIACDHVFFFLPPTARYSPQAQTQDKKYRARGRATTETCSQDATSEEQCIMYPYRLSNAF